MAFRELRGRKALAGVAALLFAAATLSCAPQPDVDDEGYATFAREAIKVLLGRPARGVDEVESVADIAQLLGRDVAARMLMEDQEYVDHWTDILAGIMQVRFENANSLRAQDQACWGDPVPATPDASIANWVRDHGPLDGGPARPEDWNMTGFASSSVVADDLSGLYRVQLFPMSMRLGGANNRRAQVSEQFQRTFLNRDVACLRCHNPTYSASNLTDGSGNIVWQRMWTIPGHPEKALYGNYYDAAAVMDRLLPIFRGDVRRPAGPGSGIRPWGIAEECATDRNSDGVTHVGFQTLGPGAPSQGGAGFGSLDGAANPRLSIWELEQALANGIADLEDGYERFPASTPVLPPDQQSYCDVLQVFSGNCTACHSGMNPSAMLNLAASDPAGELINAASQSGASVHPFRVVPGDTGTSELWRRVEIDSMPPGGALTAGDKTTINSWIAANAPATPSAEDCNTSPIPDVDPDEAFAFLVASNLVDGIWAAVFGSRLTIDHGSPRNDDQLHMLWNLTEYTLVKEDWSLKAVLTKMLDSDWFARRAPVISQQNTAYELQPIPDPWTVVSPVDEPNPTPEQSMNGQGELVDRPGVLTLIRKMAEGLGWQAPERYPGGQYPAALAEALGQSYSVQTPGFTGVNFQSLLALEDEVGLCERSGHAEGAEDYIDVLVDAVVAFNTANPQAPLTLGEAWAKLKDRLILDPTIETAAASGLAGVAAPNTEEAAFVAFANSEDGGPADAVTLNTSTSDLSESELEAVLRSGCAVLIKTPQFLLSHLTPRGYSDNEMPRPSRLAACMPGEPCGYQEICNLWRGRLSDMGHTVVCEDRTVRKGIKFFFPGYFGTLKIATKPEIGPLVPVGSLSNRNTIAKADTLDIIRQTRTVREPIRVPPRPPIDPTGPVTTGPSVGDPIITAGGPTTRPTTGPITRPTRPATGPVTRPTIQPAVRDPALTPSTRGAVTGNGDGKIVIPRGLIESLARSPGGDIVIDRNRIMIDLGDLRTRTDPIRPDLESPDLAIGEARRNEKPLEPERQVRFDAIRTLQVERIDQDSKPMDRVRQRVETLCLEGMCGFVRRGQRHLANCLKNPTGRSCGALREVCDPRVSEGLLSCGRRPADYSDSGVFVIWAEGAQVRLAEAARLLRDGARKWVPLRGNERLQAGDLLYLPINGRLEIDSDGVVFGDHNADDARKSGVSGHVISIVGNSSASTRLATPARPGALSAAAIAAGVETNRFQSGAVIDEQYRRSVAHGARAISRPRLTLKQIEAINADFDTLHEGLEEEDDR